MSAPPSRQWVTDVAYDAFKIQDLWKKIGPEDVGLLDYYLGETPAQLKSSDQEKLFSELLADAVAIGGIVLPEPYTPEDFEFEADYLKNDYSYSEGEAHVIVTLKSNPELTGTFEYGEICFGPDFCLEDDEAY